MKRGHFIHLYMYSTWRHSTESKDPRPVTVVEDPFSDYPKERTRQHVRHENVEGYLAYRGIAHKRNARQGGAASAPLEGACIIWAISVSVSKLMSPE
jgi:hypothetical protein